MLTRIQNARRYDEAAVQLEAARRLASTDGERRRAQELTDLVAKARAAAGK